MSISAALDAGRQPSAWLQTEASSSDELRAFEQEMRALDHALRQTAPKPEAPASLHYSIMQAVRTADRPAAATREPSILRWAPLPVLGVTVLLAACWFLYIPGRQSAHPPQSLAAATAALELGGQITRTVPSAVVAPLSDELERLNRDLDSTAQFLLASLP